MISPYNQQKNTKVSKDRNSEDRSQLRATNHETSNRVRWTIAFSFPFGLHLFSTILCHTNTWRCNIKCLCPPIGRDHYFPKRIGRPGPEPRKARFRKCARTFRPVAPIKLQLTTKLKRTSPLNIWTCFSISFTVFYATSRKEINDFSNCVANLQETTYFYTLTLAILASSRKTSL